MKKYSAAKFFNSFFFLLILFFIVTYSLQLIFAIPATLLLFLYDSNFLLNQNLFFKDHPFMMPLYLYGLTSLVCLGYIILMLIRKKDRFILKTMLVKKFPQILLGLAGGLLIGGGLNFLGALVPILRGELVLQISDSFNIPGLILFLFLVFLQSSGEEIACRGFLMQRLIYRYKKPWLAVILSSLVFGMAHLLNNGVTFVSVSEIIVSGLMMALLAYAFDNYYLAFAAHCGWNYMQNIILGLPNSGNAATFSIFEVVKEPASTTLTYNPIFGVEGAFTTLLMGIAFDAILVFICIKSKKKRNIWVEAGLDIDNTKKNKIQKEASEEINVEDSSDTSIDKKESDDESPESLA